MIATENASTGQPRQENAGPVRAQHADAHVPPTCVPVRFALAPLGRRLTRVFNVDQRFSPLRTAAILLAVSAAILLAVSLRAQVATAGFPESYERWERTYGVGWGDGYHASAPSGPRPFADLPPEFPRGSERHDRRLGCPECGTRHPIGNTYYDRFDAYAASLEESRDFGSSVLVDRHRATSRHPVRPGLATARLPSVAEPASGLHADSLRRADWRHQTEPSRRGFGEPRLGTPRVAQTPESLIIRQPR